MTLAFSLLFILYLFTTSTLLVSRWYWKHMYLADEEYIKGVDTILDRLIGRGK